MARTVRVKRTSEDDPPADAGPPPDPTGAAPVTVVLPSGPKRGKRKYSKDLRGIQEADRLASRAVHRLARSAEAGVRKWRKETDRSARSRKDGAIRDALDNLAKATGKQLRVASRAPEDLVRAARSLRIRKVVKRVFPVV
jgi:hypothetical protein